MTSEIRPDARPETAFAPLPVKARTTLEILDISVKLYKRYFGVLTLWALIVAASYILNAFVGFATILTMPLMYGAASCALAAAVRGQKITFNQVWEFTKPRFGALILMILLSFVVMFAVSIVIAIAGVLLIAGLASFFDSLPGSLQIVVGIIGFLFFLVGLSVFGVISFGWLNMVPIVVCMEDDKRGVAALGRAWSLVSGHWKRVAVIALLLGLSVMIVFGIVAGFAGLLFGVGSVFTSEPSFTAILGMMVGLTMISALFAVFWTPAQTLVVAVLYLDLRVRKEALDLEWSSYSSDQALAPAPPAVALETSHSPASFGMATASTTGSDAPLSASAFSTNAPASEVGSPLSEVQHSPSEGHFPTSEMQSPAPEIHSASEAQFSAPQVQTGAAEAPSSPFAVNAPSFEVTTPNFEAPTSFAPPSPSPSPSSFGAPPPPEPPREEKP